MKKILLGIFLMGVTLSGFGQTVLKKGLMVGTTDSTAVIDSIAKYGNIFRVYSGDTRLTESDVIADTIQALKEQAVSLSATAWRKTDTTYTHKQIITYDQLQAAMSGIDPGGVSSSGVDEVLQFIVGTTSGAPANGDSIIYHPDLVDQFPYLWRGTTADMHRQTYNSTARNGITGYRTSNDTIIVRPALATGDRVWIEPKDSVEFLTFGTNSLLSGLMGYWSFEEASGTTAADAHSTNIDGTIGGTVSYHATGAINYGYDFDGTTGNVSMGTNCRPTTALSISLWFNTANITAEQQLVGNLYYGAGWSGYRVTLTADGNISFFLGTNSGTTLDKSFSSGKDDGSLHHAVCTWNGTNAYIYVDNVKSPASVMNTAIAYVAGCVLRFGSNSDANGMFYSGILDETGIYNRALTDAEVAILFSKKPYDFN